MVATLPDDWRDTFVQALGRESLSDRAANYLAARLRRYGYSAPARNFGGIVDHRPFALAERDVSPMLRSDGEELRRFRSDVQGMRRLIELSRVAVPEGDDIETTAAGFRSIAPENKAGAVGAWWNPFGPGEKEERDFSLVAASWAAYKKDGVPEKVPGTQGFYDHWTNFEKRWLDGNQDTTELPSIVHEANIVRSMLADKSATWAKVKPIEAHSAADSTPALRAAEKVDEKVQENKTLADVTNPKNSTSDVIRKAGEAASSTVPTQYKIAAGVAAALLGAAYLKAIL